MDEYDRDFDWRTIQGWLIAPLSRGGYVIGWFCWLVLVAAIVLLLRFVQVVLIKERTFQSLTSHETKATGTQPTQQTAV